MVCCCSCLLRSSNVRSTVSKAVSKVHDAVNTLRNRRHPGGINVDDMPDLILAGPPPVPRPSQREPSVNSDEESRMFHYIDSDSHAHNLVCRQYEAKKKLAAKDEFKGKFFSVFNTNAFSSNQSSTPGSGGSSVDLDVLKRTKTPGIVKNTEKKVQNPMSSDISNIDLTILEKSSSSNMDAMVPSTDSRTLDIVSNEFFSVNHVKSASLRRVNQHDSEI